jgi:hypothetical protein
MGKDAWLHALRIDPSPLFKEQLGARLRVHEPAGDTHPDWSRRALVAVAAAVVGLVLISVPAVRASVAQFVSLFRVVHFVPVPIESSRHCQPAHDGVGHSAASISRAAPLPARPAWRGPANRFRRVRAGGGWVNQEPSSGVKSRETGWPGSSVTSSSR